jgi:hypothetical protein
MPVRAPPRETSDSVTVGPRHLSWGASATVAGRRGEGIRFRAERHLPLTTRGPRSFARSILLSREWHIDIGFAAGQRTEANGGGGVGGLGGRCGAGSQQRRRGGGAPALTPGLSDQELSGLVLPRLLLSWRTVCRLRARLTRLVRALAAALAGFVRVRLRTLGLLVGLIRLLSSHLDSPLVWGHPQANNRTRWQPLPARSTSRERSPTAFSPYRGAARSPVSCRRSLSGSGRRPSPRPCRPASRRT